MRWNKMVFPTLLAAVVVVLSVVYTTMAQTEEVGPARPPSGIHMGRGFPSTKARTQAVVKVMQERRRAARLAVLKQVEAGKITSEQALKRLDGLPRSPSHLRRPHERLVWIKVQARGFENTDVEITLPWSVVVWLVAEGPRMVPTPVVAEMKKETGFDLADLDLSGLAEALHSLSQVKKPVTLLRVKGEDQQVEIMIVPDEAEVREGAKGVVERGRGRERPRGGGK